MRIDSVTLASLLAITAVPFALSASRPEPRVVRLVDTVFVKEGIDYNELSRRVALRLSDQAAKPTVIEGDLIVKGRLGVGGAPEAGTDYAVTVRAPNSASLRFISNEALADPQRTGNQHRHVGTLGLAQDGGLRLEQNSTCYTDARGCTTDDRLRRRAFSGYDSRGDYAFFLSDVDSLTGQPTAPRGQSLVFNLIDWDGQIHLNSYRPNQRIYFNGSTTLNAADLQWEVPLTPVPKVR